MMTLIRSVAPELVVLTLVLIGFAAAAAAQDLPAPDDVAAAPADAETTASGLAHKVIQAGTGTEHPGPTTNVTVHYTGWLTDGRKFDSSKDRNDPFVFPLGQRHVISGWDEGVQGMKVGGTRKLTIPPALGYGARGAGGVIPPNATLVFEVELLDVA